MPPKYLRGFVVNVFFPYDDVNDGKTRPGIILEKCSDDEYTIVYITKTDLRGKCRGRWIEKSSKEGIAMRLTHDSFINYERIKDLKVIFIDSYRGRCEFIDEIEEELNR